MMKREQQADRQGPGHLNSSRRKPARLVLVLITSLTLAACASGANTSLHSTLAPSSEPAFYEMATDDVASEPNSLASTSNVAQSEPVGWEGRWTGAEDGVQVAFTVADGKLTGGTVRSASWRSNFNGSIGDAGEITARGSMQIVGYGQLKPMSVSGAMPTIRIMDHSSNIVVVPVVRETEAQRQALQARSSTANNAEGGGLGPVGDVLGGMLVITLCTMLLLSTGQICH